MSQSPTVRDAYSDETDRIRELVKSSMTTSYALSPDDIEAIIEAEFGRDALLERFSDPDTRVSVAVIDDAVVGFVEMRVDDDEGTIRWLHVDPERRGAGVGTELFERAQSQFEEHYVDEKRAVALAANTTAGAFFERFGYEKVDERDTEIGGRESVEYVYAPGADADDVDEGSDADAETDDANATDASDPEPADIPDSVTAEDSRTIYLADETFEGSEGAFAETYTDEDRTEQYGYYCLNCDSADVSMDSMERVQCNDCGNTRKPDDGYDGSYL